MSPRLYSHFAMLGMIVYFTIMATIVLALAIFGAALAMVVLGPVAAIVVFLCIVGIFKLMLLECSPDMRFKYLESEKSDA